MSKSKNTGGLISFAPLCLNGECGIYFEFELCIKNNPGYDSLATDIYTLKENVVYSFVLLYKIVSCNLNYRTILAVNTFFNFVSRICPANSCDNQELSGYLLPLSERRKVDLLMK